MAVSPASVWRVLKQAGLLSRWKRKPSRKGAGFEQPLQPHQHWHIDVSYINVCATFYYLCSVLDGYSRSIVHWDLRESMREATAVRTHHETRQLAAAFSAGRGGASYGAQRSRMAPPVFSPSATTRTEDRQGRDGTETGGSSVLDVAPGMELRAAEKVRFARGRARKSRWCAV